MYKQGKKKPGKLTDAPICYNNRPDDFSKTTDL